MQNRLLQGPFTEIVVKRRTWVAQKQRERPPVGEQVRLAWLARLRLVDDAEAREAVTWRRFRNAAS